MAVNIGPKIGIDGEREYRNQLNNIIQQTKTLGSEMKALSAQFDKSGSSMQSNRQKVELLNKAIGANRNKLMEQRHMLDEATKKYGEADTRTLKWKQTVAETEAELARLQNELKQIPNALQVVGQKMQAVGDKMTQVGKGMTMSLTLPIVALGTAAVKTAADFEAGMSKVAAISGATGSELDALSAKAREMGETTIFSATESAQAFEYMAMAGWKTEEMLNGIEGVMDLAAASGTDLATTSDIVTDSLTAFGKSAEESGHLADIMAAASANANTNVEMMGETFRYAAPLAGTLGISMEDMALATGLMANASVKASNAGTALRTGLTRLAAPPKAAADALKQYGIATTDTEGNMLSLREIMESVREKLGDLSESEQAAALNAIFGKNAISGWAAVLNASQEDFDKLARSIDGSSGAAKSMAETMRDNLKGELTILKSNLESLGIEFGEQIMPYVKDFVKKLQDVVKWFKKLKPETKDIIVKAGAFLAAAGPLLTVGGKLVSGVGKLATGIGNVAKAVPGLISGLVGETAATEAATTAQLGLNAAQLAMPIMLVVAGIAAVTTAIIAYNKAAYESSKAATGVNDSLDRMSDGADTAVNGMQQFLDNLRQTNTEAQAAATQAEHAAGVLKEIGDSGSKSSTDLARMSVAVQQLNALFPDFGLEIDRSTGKLNKSQAEIDAYVAKAKRMGEIEKASNLVQLSLDEVANATQRVTEAQETLDTLMSDKTRIEEQAAAFKDLGIQYETGRMSLEDYRAAVEELDDRVVWHNNHVFELNGTLYSASEYAWNLEQQVNELSDSITSQEQILAAETSELETVSTTADSLQESLDSLEASEQQLAETQNQTNEAMQGTVTAAEQAAGAWDSLSQHEQDMALKAVEAMTTLQTNVESALSSQMNMFEQFKEGSAMSTQELLNNMRSQIEGVTNWERNLNELADKGINQDLLQKLAEMGPEGAGYVSTFNQMSADELRQAGRLWKEGLNIQGFMNEEAVELQTSIGMLAVGSETAFQQLGEAMGTQAKGAGEYTGQGLIDGLKAIQDQVSEAGTEMGDETIDAINQALGTHSPSTITHQSGMDTDQGLANGINAGKPMILAAINQVMNGFQNNFLNKLKSMAPQFQSAGTQITQGTASGIRGGSSQVSGAISQVVATVQQGQSQLQGQIPQWQNIGMMICAGLAAGIAAGQSAVISSVAGVVAAAIAAAQAGLQIGSPSKVADKLIGRNFDAGIAQGIRREIPTVQKAVAAMTQAMIMPVAAPVSYATAGGYGITSVSNDFGGTVINVYGADGQDVDQLADIVIDRLNDEYDRMDRVWK